MPISTQYDPSELLGDEETFRMTYEARGILHKQLIGSQTLHSCLNCDNWRMNMCEKYGVVPPPRVIVYSCPEWVADIPF